MKCGLVTLKNGRELRLSGRKILFLCGNALGHPNLNDVLTDITLIFLPKNTISVVQPCDTGIIHSFKAHFRNESSRRVHYLTEETGKDAMDCTKKRKNA